MASTTFKDLAKSMKEIDFCMLCTAGDGGMISTRPMSNNRDVDYDGDSHFFSYEETRKAEEIASNPATTLTFTAPPSLFGKPGIFIAVRGDASLVRDRAEMEKHWVADLDRWFPKGLDTPGVVMIRVRAAEISYWDGEENGSFSRPF